MKKSLLKIITNKNFLISFFVILGGGFLISLAFNIYLGVDKAKNSNNYNSSNYVLAEMSVQGWTSPTNKTKKTVNAFYNMPENKTVFNLLQGLNQTKVAPNNLTFDFKDYTFGEEVTAISYDGQKFVQDKANYWQLEIVGQTKALTKGISDVKVTKNQNKFTFVWTAVT